MSIYLHEIYFGLHLVYYTIIILIILGGDGFLILNSDMFRKWRLGKQLSDKYGQNFEVDIYSKDDPVWAEEHKYTARSEEGVCSVIKCNWCGKLLADSYAHYYYAPDMNRLLESYIGECFGEYYIVSDYYFLGTGFKLGELVDVSDSGSFDDYVSCDHEMKADFTVYLREDVTDEEMQLLWSRVLAGETKRPKSFSLRTLDILRNLSKEEAEKFQNLCKYSLHAKDTSFIPTIKSFITENNTLLIG